jgi:Leucine-rich repeat (LRR) protein
MMNTNLVIRICDVLFSYIHCARKQLSQIPNFSRITNTFYDELVLNDNYIEHIAHNAFQGLRVKRLNLSGNRIRSIDVLAFRELANYLEELIIEFNANYVHEIPDAIKFNLINLRSLKLINLNLTVMRNDTFVKYRKLEELSIVKSNLKTIESDAFRSLNQLRALHIDQNQVNDQIWPVLARDLTQLETLTLSQNNVQSLRGNFLLDKLKVFDLSSNGLQLIEKNFFVNLTRLEKLSLQNNELNSLQLTFLTLLKFLKELNLDFNRLTFLPENLFIWNQYLSYLSLQGNDLNSLTNKSFRGLSRLTYMNLARNRLQFHSNQQPFQHLNNLEVLNLDRNTQMNLSKATFNGLDETLIELSLQNCNLTKLSSITNPFGGFRHLQRLKLSSNQLYDLPENLLDNSQQSLISIDLQRNRFRSIPKLFAHPANTSKFTDIDLSSNQICTLTRHDLAQYMNLKTIGLTGNPLHCNCHLRWLKQWLVKNYDYDLMKFLQWTCTTPAYLTGKQLTIIDEQDMTCSDEDLSQCQSSARSTNRLVSFFVIISSHSLFASISTIRTNKSPCDIRDINKK